MCEQNIILKPLNTHAIPFFQILKKGVPAYKQLAFRTVLTIATNFCQILRKQLAPQQKQNMFILKPAKLLNKSMRINMSALNSLPLAPETPVCFQV